MSALPCNENGASSHHLCGNSRSVKTETIVRKHSEYFTLIMLGCFGAALLWAFNSLFGGLFYAWTMKQLEHRLGVTEAEFVAGLSQYALALAATGLVIWGTYRFITREVSSQTVKRRAELAALRTKGVALRNQCQSLRIGIPEWIAECDDWNDKTSKQ